VQTRPRARKPLFQTTPRPLFSVDAAGATFKRALYSDKRAQSLYCIKRKPRVYMPSKEPCIPSKQPYTPSEKPNRPSKKY